jgi:hypothetical protein
LINHWIYGQFTLTLVLHAVGGACYGFPRLSWNETVEAEQEQYVHARNLQRRERDDAHVDNWNLQGPSLVGTTFKERVTLRWNGQGPGWWIRKAITFTFRVGLFFVLWTIIEKIGTIPFGYCGGNLFANPFGDGVLHCSFRPKPTSWTWGEVTSITNTSSISSNINAADAVTDTCTIITNATTLLMQDGINNTTEQTVHLASNGSSITPENTWNSLSTSVNAALWDMFDVTSGKSAQLENVLLVVVSPLMPYILLASGVSFATACWLAMLSVIARNLVELGAWTFLGLIGVFIGALSNQQDLSNWSIFGYIGHNMATTPATRAQRFRNWVALWCFNFVFKVWCRVYVVVLLATAFALEVKWGIRVVVCPPRIDKAVNGCEV